MGLSLTGFSMPIFWWGLLLIMFFSVAMRDIAPDWALPVSGRMALEFDIAPRTGLMLIDAWLSGEEGAFRSAVSHLVLPSIVLGTVPLAVIARMTRSSMLEVLREDYVRTARAKGLAPARVVFVHALRNALVPVITVMGLLVGSLLGGAVLTETIFSWPGVGKWLIDAIARRDYPVVQGGILITATLVIVVNLVVDLLYGLVNPRIRHSK
jgi:dipeptide transport system permease protein